MSSTNRGYNRHVSDYYVTPQSVVYEFLNAFLTDESSGSEYLKIIDRPDKAAWLDPCAGGDSKHEMSYASVIQREFEPEALATIDIREDSLAESHSDYLTQRCPGFDIIISNPPFYLAQEFIEKALSEVNEGGYVIMLLRLNFLGSAKRFDFWLDNPAKSIYVHHKRISFTEKGGTDSIEYAHFVWQKGYTGGTTLKVI